MKDLLAKIVNFVESRINTKESLADKGNFAEINSRISGNKIAFIDGGQAELLKSADFSLQFIRAAAVIYANNKKISSFLNEFFLLVYAEGADKQIYYKTEIFQAKGTAIESFSMHSFDSSIKEGNERAEISKIGSIARRFAELKLAKEVAGKLDKNDVIVLDGSLKCTVKGENERMQEIAESTGKKGIILSSVAKTSRILSETGDCPISQLNLAGEKKEWHYNIGKETNYIIEAVKLNKSSSYVFEFNILNEQKEQMDNVLGILASNSNDAVFPGYPYGLIMADKLARVSNSEKDYLLTLLKAKFGRRWKDVEASLNVMNGHDVLDRIS
jgi:hypothetical protein